MKILVLGGNRFFGKRLVELLLAEGHEVVQFSRSQNSFNSDKKPHWISGDRRRLMDLKTAALLGPFDHIVDQICMTAEDANLAIEAFSEATPHYVMTSTLSVYPMGKALKEDVVVPINYQPKEVSTPAEAYGEGKRAAEHAFATKALFSTAFLRIPVVLGEDDYTERLKTHVQKVQKGEAIYFPNLEANFSFIHAQDAARALYWLIEGRKSGAYNVASEDTLRLRKLINMIEEATGCQAHLPETPSEKDWSSFGVPEDWYMDVSKAKSEGFLASPLSDWLAGLIRHHR